MNSIEILARLEQVNFTTEQARTITEIMEEHQKELATKNDVKTIREDLREMATRSELKTELKAMENMMYSTVAKAKYDLVKWIVGAVVANGVIAALLKFLS